MNAPTTIARLVLVAIFVATGAVSGLAADREAVGRWNLTVDTGAYTHPAWLAVKPKDPRAEPGKYIGEFLGGAGSVGDIGEVKVDEAKIEFNAHGHKWTGTIKGDTITGTRVNDKGDKSTWTGQRSIRKFDLTGKWHLKRSGAPVPHPPVLELEQKGEKVTGKFTEGGKTVDITNAWVKAGMFFGWTVEGPSARREYRASVKGDVLDDGLGQEGRRRYLFTGYRQREWGGPIELFNGKDLNNWKPLGNVNDYKWKVIDGIMTNTGGGGSANIVSKERFRDFRMHVEFRVPQGGNSGVYLRGRHEIQISDSFGHAASWHVCGALYSRIAPNVNAARKHGQWQTLDVTLIGPYLTVAHNGQVIIDNEEMRGITGGAIDSKESEPGPIYLQGDHGAIEYRKITIWPAK